MGAKIKSLQEKRDQERVQAIEHDMLLVLVKRAGRIRVTDTELAELRAGDGVELTVKDNEVTLEWRRDNAPLPNAG